TQARACREMETETNKTSRILAGNAFSLKTINNALSRNSLYAQSQVKTPLLKKKPANACLNIAAEDLDKPSEHWENIFRQR
uniref:Uncharacterized protein n=1 Tax=Fundulus heteroclitus TaxID=8078 RepID=A0A3Q2NV05_FUNHE